MDCLSIELHIILMYWLIVVISAEKASSVHEANKFFV